MDGAKAKGACGKWIQLAFGCHVQDTTRIVLDIEGGLRLMEASPQARLLGEGVC